MFWDRCIEKTITSDGIKIEKVKIDDETSEQT